MKKVRGFTLIELLIVLAIIASMMTITLRFGGNFINDTSFKQERDTLLTDYQIAVGHTLGSRYIAGDKAYDTLEVEFTQSDTVVYRFLSETGVFLEQENTYDRLNVSLLDPSPLVLQLKPYELGCSIQGLGTGSSARIKISSPELSNKEFCYELHSSTCKRTQFLGEGERCDQSL